MITVKEFIERLQKLIEEKKISEDDVVLGDLPGETTIMVDIEEPEEKSEDDTSFFVDQGTVKIIFSKPDDIVS